MRGRTNGKAQAAAPDDRAEQGVTCTLSVGGMDCAGCATNVEKALRCLEGVQDVRADVLGERVTVRYAESKIARDDLVSTVHRVGYQVKDDRPARQEAVEVEPTWWERRGRLALALVSGVLWIGSLVAEQLTVPGGIGALLSVGAIVSGGWFIVPRGIRAAMNRSLDMNFLMSLAAVGALIIGEYGEAASAMFLFALAQLLETYSMDRARNSIRALMDLSPAEATVLRAGREQRVGVDEVGVGEIVVVRPGEKVPVDGEIGAGHSTVNQAPITGESVPVEKEPGGEVFAGTINGEGALEIRSTKPAADTTLARIIHSVEEAQASRAPSQSFVDRFARVYTPAVVGVALLVAVIPPLLAGGGWGEWFYRALVLLVVACPCALVISTPVTVVSALAGAARRGILIKGGLHLENAGRARVVALDKTGTLTEGKPTVVDVVAFDGGSPARVLALAAAVEARSEHPLGRAILRRVEEEGIEVEPASDTRATPGRGIQARVNGSVVRVGSERFFGETASLNGRVRETLEHFAAQGRTAILVGSAQPGRDEDFRILGAMSIADRIRSDASRALADLHHAGIARIVMLTGDNPSTARAVAKHLGVDDYDAELLPEDKVQAVRELRAAYGRVVMVGDGVNDAPALAVADVGVAMGSAGTDIALETADIALMTDDLSKLATTILLARKAERIIKTNIWLSLLSKAVFVVLAVAGMATLWMAVLADMGASLLVVLNGLRAMNAPRSVRSTRGDPMEMLRTE